MEKLGRAAEAAACRTQALERASALQLYAYGRQLQGEKKPEQAFALYLSNARKFPQHWTSHLGLARAASARGDFEDAAKEIKAALAVAPEANHSTLENYLRRLQAKDDINQ